MVILEVRHMRLGIALQRALAIREKAFGKEHEDVAKSVNDLAVTYLNLAEYDRALPLYQRALAANLEAGKRRIPGVGDRGCGGRRARRRDGCNQQTAISPTAGDAVRS